MRTTMSEVRRNSVVNIGRSRQQGLSMERSQLRRRLADSRLGVSRHNYHRARDLVMPALLATIESDPEESQPEREAGNDEAQIARDAPSHGQAVPGSRVH